VRFYQTFPIALNEIRRDLKEMGIRVTTKSVQNVIGDVEAFELQNYIYTVTQPDWRQILVPNAAWCAAEFDERISGQFLNPGEAYKLRNGFWEKYLNKDGKFDYSYPERLSQNLGHVINLLKKDINSRRAFLPVVDFVEDQVDLLDRRFPCSLGYWFNYRQDQLNMTYLLRSSDYFEHLHYDLVLAHRLQCHVAESVGVKPGNFCQWVGSLHCFQSNVKDVF
jgi:thymidylate synthase